MRKFAWLMAFAAAALLFGAADNAFAHPSHHHVQQAQSAPALNADLVSHIVEHDIHADEYVSAAAPQTEKCPHGHSQADCDSCCACAASASVAVATSDVINREMRTGSAGLWLASPYLVRETVLDLSRPPKSFA